MIELLNIDCMEYMASQPDNSFDLAIVDPPYGINAPKMSMGQNLNRDDGWNRKESTAVKAKKGRLNTGSGKLKNRALNTMDCEWDFKAPDENYFKELIRVSQNQIIWGGNYFDLPPTRCIVCWDKVQPWENFSQWEMAWTSFDMPAAMFRYSNTGGANAEIKIHPTQKPRRLYEFLLNKFGYEDARVLDTHLGSGSSAIAAHYFGCDFVGMEIDEDYFNAAKARFEAETAQAAMF
jgi:site-specific DNA-methyltransferase (adenine-specific)